ncbi:MAG TPA: glycosyltransferase, partial [bacterium]
DAFCRAGHSVSVISPAIEYRGKGQGDGLQKRNSSFLPSWHGSSPDLESDVADMSKESRARLFPAYPPQERLFRGCREIEDLEEFLGAKTRIRQELRNLFYNSTLYQRARDYLLLDHVNLIYERYTLFSFAGIRLARELGVPHILEVNAPLAYEQEKMRGLEMKALAQLTERQILCESDQVIVVSRALKEYAEACGVPSSRVYILPNAINRQLFDPANSGAQVREQYGFNGKRVVGFVGSLKPWHGTRTLFQAFQQLHSHDKNTHLLIVGDGPEREDLETYVQANSLNSAITFSGNVSHENIPHYIAAMDVTVAPYVPNENFYYSPIKIFEYMAMGKPVIAAKIGQVEEVITDGRTGVLFEPGNVSELCSTLGNLLHDPRLCKRLGKEACAWVSEERTWENNARQVVELAWELIETKTVERRPKNMERAA